MINTIEQIIFFIFYCGILNILNTFNFCITYWKGFFYENYKK